MTHFTHQDKTKYWIKALVPFMKQLTLKLQYTEMWTTYCDSLIVMIHIFTEMGVWTCLLWLVKGIFLFNFLLHPRLFSCPWMSQKFSLWGARIPWWTTVPCFPVFRVYYQRHFPIIVLCSIPYSVQESTF